MPSELGRFEQVARRAHQFSEARERSRGFDHPFGERNIAPELPAIVQQLFDNGHYAQATFEAYKFVDKEIQRHAKSSKSGFNLMMDVLGGSSPVVRLTPMLTVSQQDEQKGFQFLFAGAVLAIRNPRGHEHAVNDDPDLCLDHLSLASLLLRRLADAGYK
jgi:uncharacterized protein (TIGR02391 family)